MNYHTQIHIINASFPVIFGEVVETLGNTDINREKVPRAFSLSIVSIPVTASDSCVHSGKEANVSYVHTSQVPMAS